MPRERQTSITIATIAGAALVIMFVVLIVFVASRRSLEQTVDQEEPAAVNSPAATLPTEAASEAHQGLIFGRVTADDGVIYEGRLRFGGDEEAFWGDYFNGSKKGNPWEAQAPLEQLRERDALEIFGIKVFRWERQINLARPFMVRFGDITRIESDGWNLRVTLKSRTVFHLDLFAADDFADGVRVWDERRGVVNLIEEEIRSIDLLPTGRLATAPDRLHGAVRTRAGEFTGFIQWDREKGVASDELDGYTIKNEPLNLRFDAIRSIERSSSNTSLVTLVDGQEVVRSDTRDVVPGSSGIYVDDRRYGRVLISWDVLERVDFSPGGNGPAYGEFPTGRPLTGAVMTRDGRRLAGRLVYDLDESETIETLDAPSQGVDYTILFGLIDSIALPAPEQRGAGRATVTLHSGEMLKLELAGDLGEGNAGMLIFVDGRKQPEYARWTEIRQIHFDRPAAMYPPLGRR